jgi:hypothetical protein
VVSFMGAHFPDPRPISHAIAKPSASAAIAGSLGVSKRGTLLQSAAQPSERPDL